MHASKSMSGSSMIEALLKARSREAVGEVKGDVEVKTQVSRTLLVSITVMNIL